MFLTKLFAVFQLRNGHSSFRSVKQSKLAWLLGVFLVVGCDSGGQSNSVAPSDENSVFSDEIGTILSTRPDADIRLPTAVTATGGLELLENGSIGVWPSVWEACNDNSVPGFNAGNLVIPAGNCIQQLVSVLPGDQLNLTCNVGLTPAPARWTGVGLSFYGQNRNFISEPTPALVNSTESREYSVAGTVPDGAAFALAWIYSDSGAYSRSGVGCSLISTGTPTGPEDPITGNLLNNAEFDEVVNGSAVSWTNYCPGNANVISNQGDTGVALTGSACLTQSLDASKISAVRGNAIRLSCTVEKDNGFYASIGTNLLTGQHREQLISRRDGRFEVSLSGQASSDIVNGYVSVNGSSRVYDCALEIIDEPQQNQAPVAAYDFFEFEADDWGAYVTLRLLDNDIDPEGDLDPSSFEITQQPSVGTVFPFGRNTDYSVRSPVPAVVTFRYTVADRQGLRSNEATVTINFTGNQDGEPPVAVDDFYTFDFSPQGGTFEMDILSNDLELQDDLDLRSLIITQQPETGILRYGDGAGGRVGTIALITPSSTDVTWRYTVANFDGLRSNEATVTVTFENPDDLNAAPVANNDFFTLQPGSRRASINVIANDFDPDGSFISEPVVEFGPFDGYIENIENGVVTYVHTGAGDSNDVFSYYLTDSDGARSRLADVGIGFPEPLSKAIGLRPGLNNPVVDGVVTGAEYGYRAATEVTEFLIDDFTDRPVQFRDFNVGQDGDFLYFRVSIVKQLVSDSNPVNGNLWDDDSFEIYFDLGNDTTDGNDSNDFGRVYGFGKQGAPDIFTGQNSLAQLTNVAQCNIIESGTEQFSTCEVRFDLAEMGLDGPGIRELGFDLHLNVDFDGGVRDRKLSWCSNQTRAAWRDMSVVDCSIFLID